MSVRRPPLLPVVTALAAGYLITRCYGVSATAPDFRVYRDAARAAWAGVDLYSIDTAAPGSAGNPFTYPPVAALLLLPTTWCGWRTGYLLLTAVAMLALLRGLGEFLPRSVPRRNLVLAGAVAAAATTRVVVTHIGFGQVNLLLMALCLIDLRRRDDARLPRGALVGVATAIKLTPGLFLVYFAITGQWRLLRAGAVSAVAVTLVGAAVYPAMTADFFGHAVWHLTDRVDLDHPVGYWGNNSVTGALAALKGWPSGLTLPVVLAVTGGCLAAARRLHRHGREADAWLVVGLAAPVVSTFSWTHHYVYLLPALVRLAPRSRRPVPLVGYAGVVAALHRGPGLGAAWLRSGNPLLVVPGVLLRESLVLLSLAAVLALALRGRASAREEWSRAGAARPDAAGRPRPHLRPRRRAGRVPAGVRPHPQDRLDVDAVGAGRAGRDPA